MESAVTSTAVATTSGKMSTTKKILWIGIPLLLIGGTVAYFMLRKKPDDSTTGDGSTGGDANKGGGATGGDAKKGDNTKGGGATGDDKNKKAVQETKETTTVTKTPTSTNTTKTTTVSTTVHDMSSLPNGGKGCGQVQSTFDGNYDYVKCGTSWFTISKANPTSASTKGSIPNWKDLSGNAIATQRLNSRYPNG